MHWPAASLKQAAAIEIIGVLVYVRVRCSRSRPPRFRRLLEKIFLTERVLHLKLTLTQTLTLTLNVMRHVLWVMGHGSWVQRQGLGLAFILH